MSEPYDIGATDRLNGLSKLRSTERFRESDWQSRNELRRGWDDMDTFARMLTIVNKNKKA